MGSESLRDTTLPPSEDDFDDIGILRNSNAACCVCAKLLKHHTNMHVMQNILLLIVVFVNFCKVTYFLFDSGI